MLTEGRQLLKDILIAEAPRQEAAAGVGKAEVDAVMACLPDLSSREMCDEVSVNFAFVSSKGARKRMVTASAVLNSIFCIYFEIAL